MGRNSFQRPHDEAVQLLTDVMDIHRTTPVLTPTLTGVP
jgi:class I fructose-bisphosphate aldolase